jgi:hypothetical protein
VQLPHEEVHQVPVHVLLQHGPPEDALEEAQDIVQLSGQAGGDGGVTVVAGVRVGGDDGTDAVPAQVRRWGSNQLPLLFQPFFCLALTFLSSPLPF